MKLQIIVGSAFLVAACSITEPVAVVSEDGKILRGTTTAEMTGEGSFTVTGDDMTCTGNYNAFDMSPTIPLSVLCDNGITGIGSATRTNDGRSGSGTFTDSNGKDWRFVFGANAAALM